MFLIKAPYEPKIFLEVACFEIGPSETYLFLYDAYHPQNLSAAMPANHTKGSIIPPSQRKNVWMVLKCVQYARKASCHTGEVKFWGNLNLNLIYKKPKA